MQTTKRKILRAGKISLAVTLPKGWVDYYELKPGDEVDIISDGSIVIKPHEVKDD